MKQRLDPSLVAMQLNVPVSVYGSCDYLAPPSLVKWLSDNKLQYPSYCGSNSSGTGYTEAGVSNKICSYMVYNVHPNDPIALKIQHPHIHIYVSEQKTYD